MEADVVKWLQCLRHSVDEESSESGNSFSVHCDSVLDSTIDTWFDFDSSSTTSVSDFEYFSMNQPDTRFLTFSENDGEDNSDPNDVFLMFPNKGVSASFKSKCCNVVAWKNDLIDSALKDTSSEDEQVLVLVKTKKKKKIN